MIPSIFGKNFIYSTIFYVESFVEKHYEEQIQILKKKQQHNHLKKILIDLMGDEVSHKNESLENVSDLKFYHKFWGKLISSGSKLAVQISKENLSQLKRVLSSQFGISNNAASVILEKKLNYSITEKVEKVEVYREKYDLVAFLWEKILSTEESINDGEMGLIRKWIRRLDISDVESEGARKDAMALLNPSS